jgi:hypothetical protein
VLSRIFAVFLTLAASGASAQSVDRFPPAQRERVMAATRTSLELLTNWFGDSALQQPALDGVPVRWLAFERDRSLERAVIASVTRQYWSHSFGRDHLGPFEESVVYYTAVRAIHEQLERNNFAGVRFFGGLLTFPLRSLLLSPPVAEPLPRVWRFEELRSDPDVLRLVRGLQTVERYIGWPAMAQTLTALRTTGGAQADVAAFASILSAIRGMDLRGVIEECFRPDAVFDYAIGDVRTSATGGAVETAVMVVRQGSGVFEAGTAADPERTLPLLLRFADGSELRDWFDGAAKTTALVYTTNARVVSAAIDPEMMLLLDADRANNTFTTAVSFHPLGVRLALHWMSWLQQMMLTYSALV